MVALLVLGICAVPAADALRTGANAALVAAAKARELRCLKSHMESVLAEPYQNLAEAAREDGRPTTYSLGDDGACGPRFVFIARYERKYQMAEKFLTTSNSTAIERDNAMLHITVASTDPTDPAPAASANGGSYSFTTLVIR